MLSNKKNVKKIKKSEKKKVDVDLCGFMWIMWIAKKNVPRTSKCISHKQMKSAISRI